MLNIREADDILCSISNATYQIRHQTQQFKSGITNEVSQTQYTKDRILSSAYLMKHYL